MHGNTKRTTLAKVMLTLLGTLGLMTRGMCQSELTFTTVDFPGFATYNAPLGIDDRGDLAGFYDDSTGAIHGYICVKGKFSTIDYPGSTSTYCSSMTENGD